jgi:hypothetical protein
LDGGNILSQVSLGKSRKVTLAQSPESETNQTNWTVILSHHPKNGLANETAFSICDRIHSLPGYTCVRHGRHSNVNPRTHPPRSIDERCTDISDVRNTYPPNSGCFQLEVILILSGFLAVRSFSRKTSRDQTDAFRKSFIGLTKIAQLCASSINGKSAGKLAAPITRLRSADRSVRSLVRSEPAS